MMADVLVRQDMLFHVKRITPSIRFALVLALFPLLVRADDVPVPATPPEGASQKIYVLHLPGIGGLMRIDRLLTGGLERGGINGQIIIHDWTNGTRGLRALAAIERNKQEARRIATMIEHRLREDPETRIILTGHSGGTGLAVWALECLPEDVQIDTLLMIAPALSPGYDLSEALKRVRGRAYSFNSEYDPVLGPGTRAFGTIDRIMTSAAGRVGFDMPEGADAEQYAKLVQIPYDRGFMAFGNIGDHIGAMMPRFAANVIAPLLLNGELPLATTQPASQPATAPAR